MSKRDVRDFVERLNKMKKITFVLAVVLIIGLSNSIKAQTTQSLLWDYNAVAPSEVSTYTQTITVDGTLMKTVPSCVAGNVATDTTCTLVIPTLTSGSHTISILAAKNGMTSELRVSGLDPNNAPRSPSNVHISIVINVNIP